MSIYRNYYHHLSTTRNVLILGAGFGGLASATFLRKSLPREECQITVIDKNQAFYDGNCKFMDAERKQKIGGLSSRLEQAGR